MKSNNPHNQFGSAKKQNPNSSCVGNMKQVRMYLSQDTVRKLSIEANGRGLTLSQLADILLTANVK